MKTISQKTATLFLICLIALAITGYAYSHWTDIVTIFTTANMGHLEITIDDQKLIPATSYTKTPDNHTLELNGSITPGQTIWTGIIIKNNGTTPVTITYQITTNNTLVWETNFTHNEYFYGPYATDPPSSVWENPPTLPPSGGSSTPPELPSKNKLVAWQNITLDSTCPPNAFTAIEITVAYTATFSTWTDTVYVKYTLTYQTP